MRFRLLLSAAAWQYAGLVLNVILQFILTLLIAPEVFGAFAKLQSISAVLVSFVAVGLHSVLVFMDTADENKLIHHVFWLSLFQTLVLVLFTSILLVVLYYLSWYNVEESLWTLATVFSSGLLVSKQIFYVVYEKQKAFVFNSKINFALHLFSFVVSLLWITFSPTLAALAGRIVLSNILFFAVYLGLAFWHLQCKLRWKPLEMSLIKKILNFTMRLYLSRLIETLQSRIDILVASYFFDNYQIGLYERVRYYAILPQTLLNGFSARINSINFKTNPNLIQLHQGNFLLLVSNSIGYFAFFALLFLINQQFNIPAFANLYPLYFAFWHFAGLFSILDNVRTYLQLHSNIVRTSLKLRLSVLVCFLSIVFAYSLLFSQITLFTYAFLSAISHLIVFFFVPLHLFRIQSRRFINLFWWQMTKKK
jgi:hypothetical protein